MSRPPVPPFDAESAARKTRSAEDAWNTRDSVSSDVAFTPAVSLAADTGCGAKSPGTPVSARRASSATRRVAAEPRAFPGPASSVRTDVVNAAADGGPGSAAGVPVRAARTTASAIGAAKRTMPDA